VLKGLHDGILGLELLISQGKYKNALAKARNFWIKHAPVVVIITITKSNDQGRPAGLFTIACRTS